MYFGKLNSPVSNFLAIHEDWYITTGMLSEWTLLLGLSIAFIGYIRAKVLHKKIKFKIDEHAFHLREGLFMIKESTIPYKQISNVHIVRPYLFRFIGLARLDIMTVSDKDVLRRSAGTKTGDYLIPLIDTDLARELASHLMKHATGQKNTLADSKEGSETEEYENYADIEEGDTNDQDQEKDSQQKNKESNIEENLYV
jgi:uncharacterized membrane protein YdbT with pleckstrin-like domain